MEEESRMRFDKFTLKSQEVIQGAQQLADRIGHQQVEPEHIVRVILSQKEGVIPPLLGKLGANQGQLVQEVEELLQRVPKVSGAGAGQVYISPRTKGVLDRAFEEAEQMKDEYVSLEHILLAVLEEKGSDLSRIFARLGISREGVLQALVDIRGGQRITDQNPEDKYQALEKFGRDLTAIAAKGTLDPVIGRDEEIRRIVQVLSRRTKNNPVLIGEPGVGKTAIVEGLAQIGRASCRERV